MNDMRSIKSNTTHTRFLQRASKVVHSFRRHFFDAMCACRDDLLGASGLTLDELTEAELEIQSI